MLEAHVLIENWGKDYNWTGSHSALGYETPAPEAIMRLSEQKSLTLMVVQSFGGGSFSSEI
jgi:transposase InsO family protein